jgi:ATP-binding cassette subfamily B protein
MIDDIKSYLCTLIQYTRRGALPILSGVLLATVSQICMLATPFLTKYLIDDIIARSDYSLLFVFLLLSTLVIVILLVTSFTAHYLLIRSFRKSGLRLRADIFAKVQNAPLRFFKKNSSGEISYRLLHDTQVIEDSWNSVLVTLPLQIVLLLSSVVMAIWHGELTLFVLLVLMLQVIVITRFRKPMLRYFKQSKEKGQIVSGYVVDHFQKVQLIRSLSAENKEQIKFHKKQHEYIKATIRASLTSKLSAAIVTVVNNLWVFGILLYGGGLVISGVMSLGTLMAFLLLANLLSQPVATLTHLILSFQDVRASMQRVKEYAVLPPHVVEVPDAKEYVPAKGRIRLNDVTFGYNSHPVLKHIDLEIPANSIFALVGENGAGKTTLCRLLVRFIDPDTGTIKIDDKSIHSMTLSSLRRSVLLILQDDYVIRDTIWNNITYGMHDFTEEAVYQAVQQAGLDFLHELPEGLHSRIGDGREFSAGETQRIALARAFLRAPKVLILDEPTAFIDRKTEEKVKKSLLDLKKRCTIILIAHRSSTIEIADRIGVLDNGTIAEIGAHDELMNKKTSVYRKVYVSAIS